MKKEEYFKSAVIQYKSVKGSVEKNRDNIEELCLKALEQNVRLIVLPEMCLTGYIWPDIESISKYAEEYDGESFEYFSKLCRNNDCYLAYGFAEKEDDALYNSQNLISPNGSLLLSYRKMHLFLADEIWALPGNKGFMNIDTPIGRLGMGICMDINYDDFIEFHRDNRTDYLLFSSNWLEQNIDVHHYWKVRLKDFPNTTFIANTFGYEYDIEFCGQSAVLSGTDFVDKAPRSGDAVIITEHKIIG